MSNFREKLKQGGYDAEDAYFYKRDQELIEKMREDNAKAKDHLQLIKGSADDRKLLTEGRPEGRTDGRPQNRSNKKAA